MLNKQQRLHELSADLVRALEALSNEYDNEHEFLEHVDECLDEMGRVFPVAI